MDEKENKSSKVAYIIVGVLVCLLVGLVGYVIGTAHASLHKPVVDLSGTAEVVANAEPAPTVTPISTPRPTVTPLPNPPSGTLLEPSFLLTNYKQSELTVTTASDSDYYIYFEYENTWSELQKNLEVTNNPTALETLKSYSNESTSEESASSVMDFMSAHVGYYVQGGKTAKLHVPAGICSIRYATGKDWYGIENSTYFGRDTVYTRCTNTFDFENNTSELTLYYVPNGNLNIELISKDEF